MMEDQDNEVQEAMDMLGQGYDHPTVEIAPAHTVVERRGQEFQEVVRPAFVKISTGFKSEMKNIDEVALKVWLYIALSVNRYSGRANPGLRTIAKDCALAVNTVRSAIERLENEYNLLMVDRESKRYNIYEPLAFVSANRNEPVSSADTPPETVSIEDESVSIEGQSVSARVILNQRNQRNQSSASFSKSFSEQKEEAKERIEEQRKGKGDIVDLFMKVSPELKAQTEMRQRVENALRRNLDWDSARSPWNGYDKKLIKREQEAGENIERFMDWFNGDEFRKKGVIYLTPTKIEDWWLQAFDEQKSWSPIPSVEETRQKLEHETWRVGKPKPISELLKGQ